MLKMKERLTELINGAVRTLDAPEAAELADYLVSAGVLVPPVKLGATVYAAINSILDTDGEPYIAEYTVKALGFTGGAWYVAGEDGEPFGVGSELCKLTRAEAEAVLAEKSGKCRTEEYT